MSAILNGMAVLVIRILFVFVSYYILREVDWRKLFTERNYYIARYLCILTSLAIGHLAGSFFITIIELLQSILLSSFL